MLTSARKVRWLTWREADAIGEANTTAAERLTKILGGRLSGGVGLVGGSTSRRDGLDGRDSDGSSVAGSNDGDGIAALTQSLADASLVGVDVDARLGHHGPHGASVVGIRSESPLRLPVQMSGVATSDTGLSGDASALSDHSDSDSECKSRDPSDSASAVSSGGPLAAPVASRRDELGALVACLEDIARQNRDTASGTTRVTDADLDSRMRRIVHRITEQLHPLRHQWAGQYVATDSEHALVNCWHGCSLELLLLEYAVAGTTQALGTAQPLGTTQPLGTAQPLTIKGYVLCRAPSHVKMFRLKYDLRSILDVVLNLRADFVVPVFPTSRSSCFRQRCQMVRVRAVHIPSYRRHIADDGCASGRGRLREAGGLFISAERLVHGIVEGIQTRSVEPLAGLLRLVCVS